MTDTIELLEAIGSDASLRYAQTGELKGVLEEVQASVELTMAAALGDSASLYQGLKLQQTPHFPQTQVPGHEEDEDEDEDEDGDCDAPKPEQCRPGHAPFPPHKRDSSN